MCKTAYTTKTRRRRRPVCNIVVEASETRGVVHGSYTDAAHAHLADIATDGTRTFFRDANVCCKMRKPSGWTEYSTTLGYQVDSTVVNVAYPKQMCNPDLAVAAHLELHAENRRSNKLRFFEILNQDNHADVEFSIILDKSQSMIGNRWWDAGRSLNKLADYVKNGRGLNFYAFNDYWWLYRNVKTSRELEHFIAHEKPHGGSKLHTVLQHALEDTFRQHGRRHAILVIVDGIPEQPDQVEVVLSGASQRLRGANHVAVSFLQVGEDEFASEWMKWIGTTRDTPLLYPIVDSVSSDLWAPGEDFASCLSKGGACIMPRSNEKPRPCQSSWAGQYCECDEYNQLGQCEAVRLLQSGHDLDEGECLSKAPHGYGRPMPCHDEKQLSPRYGVKTTNHCCGLSCSSRSFTGMCISVRLVDGDDKLSVTAADCRARAPPLFDTPQTCDSWNTYLQCCAMTYRGPGDVNKIHPLSVDV